MEILKLEFRFNSKGIEKLKSKEPPIITMDPFENPLPNYNNDTTLEKADGERITKFVLTC